MIIFLFNIFKGTDMNVREINEIIKKMKVPHLINRKFPIIHTNPVKWKSSELKLFIFYWCLPLLLNILDDGFWYLLCTYVFSVRKLYEPIKSEDDILNSQALIDTYVSQLDNFL